MRIIALLATAAAMGCASSTSSPGPVPRETIQRTPEDVEFRTQGSLRVDTIAAPAAATVRAMIEAYQALEIPVTRVEESEGVLETEGLRLSSLAGERMSRFLDCGRGAGGERADSYDVGVTLLTSIDAAGADWSVVRIELDAFARPRATSGNDVYCSSRGRLEALIFEEIRARTGGGTD